MAGKAHESAPVRLYSGPVGLVCVTSLRLDRHTNEEGGSMSIKAQNTGCGDRTNLLPGTGGRFYFATAIRTSGRRTGNDSQRSLPIPPGILGRLVWKQ